MSSERVAFITGCSGGFGLRTAVEMAKAGYSVIAAIRNPAKQGELEAASAEAGVADKICCVTLDVTDHEAVRGTISSVIDRYGSIEVLVNNAGFAAGGFAEEVPMPVWRSQMETNLFGVIAVTRAVLPFMRRQGNGLIVMVSSISGRMGLPGYAPYAASKFAVEGFSESLRHEMLPHGVNVVLVEPGAYRTNIWSKGLADLSANPSSPYYKQLSDVLSLTRRTAANAPDPLEVAKSIVRIADKRSPKLRYPMGKGARLTLWCKAVLPWKLFERIVRRMLVKGR